MDEHAQMGPQMCESLARIEEHVQYRMTGLLHEFQLVVRDRGLVLRGRVHTYYAKQLAQHAVFEVASVPILANDIEVI
jgi:hypothetical protein